MPGGSKKQKTPLLTPAEQPTWLLQAKAPTWQIPFWVDGAPQVVTREGSALDRPSRHRLWDAMRRGGTTLDRFLALLDADSLRAHVWHLFSAWAERDGNMEQRWVFEGVRIVLDDAHAWKLLPVVERWIRGNEKNAAKAGLALLVAHGTPVALRVVQSLAERFDDEAVYNLPRATLAREAARREQSLDELEDRLVPSGGLDAETARAMLSVQRARLERALSSGRDWSVSDWQERLREHVLLRELTRRLVWGQYDESGTLVRSFRVDAENVLTDERDEPTELDADARIRLAHPVELSRASRAAWGELFSDYELIPPFAQLARPVKTVHPDDSGGHTLRHLPTRAMDVASLHSTLNRLGWSEGEPDEHLRIRYFAKRFERAAMVAVLLLDPGFDVTVRDDSLQTASEIWFVHRAPGGISFDRAPRVPLAEVPFAMLSEVLHDAAALAG